MIPCDERPYDGHAQGAGRACNKHLHCNDLLTVRAGPSVVGTVATSGRPEDHRVLFESARAPLLDEAIECGPCLVSPEAKGCRGIRCRELTGRAKQNRRKFLPRVVGFGQPAETIVVAATEEVEDRGCPPMLLFGLAGLRHHEETLEDLERPLHSRGIRKAEQEAQLWSGHGACLEQHSGKLGLDRREQTRVQEIVYTTTATGKRVDDREQVKRNEGEPATDVLAYTGEALLSELVFPEPYPLELGREHTLSLGVQGEHFQPAGSGDGLPERGQDEVIAWKDKGDSDATHELRGTDDGSDPGKYILMARHRGR